MPRRGCGFSQVQRGSRDDVRTNCNCGWELRLGYGVAVSLAIFEAKRLILLALELFVEWQVIRFAGGYTPVVLTFVDIALGLPCALAAVCNIRKYQAYPFCSKSRRFFSYLLAIITVCGLLNVVTMLSIGYHVSVRRRALASVFNASMQLYVTSASAKYAVDQIQIVLQCCGHTAYSDWFLFDWQQMVDYASREDMARHRRISDEIYRDRSVPFSCCNLRVLRACAHYEMSKEDTDTVNIDGCSGVLSNVLVKIVFVAYIMSTMLVLTQAILAFFLARIVKKYRSNKKKSFSGYSQFSCGSTSPISSSEVPSPIEKPFASAPLASTESGRVSKHVVKAWKTPAGSGRKINNRREINKTGGSGAVVSGFSELSQDSSPSTNETSTDTARIKPSSHVQHSVPKKKLLIKTIR